MKLALRTGSAVGSTGMDDFASKIIKIRLVSEYPHAGIVIGDTLYHSNGKKGLHAEPFKPERWVTIDVGSERDAAVLAMFEANKGASYDWLSLLAFVQIRARNSDAYYCYEWCYEAMTGEHPKGRVTPETLVMLALVMKGIIPAVK